MSKLLIMVLLNSGIEGWSLPSGGIILWHGLLTGNTPPGFEKFASASDALIRGAAAMGADVVKAGALTHTHTIPNALSAGAHTHTFSGTSSTTTTRNTGQLYASGDPIARYSHSHSYSGSGSSAGAHSHSISPTGEVSNLPLYHRLHYIQSTTPIIFLPVGSIITLAVPPSVLGAGWQLCDGANGTPNLVNRFVFAAKEDVNVDETGGSAAHLHTTPDTNSVADHVHPLSGTLSSESAASVGYAAGYGDRYLAMYQHTHSLSGNTGENGGHSHALGDTGESEAEPPFKKLYYVMRVS